MEHFVPANDLRTLGLRSGKQTARRWPCEPSQPAEELDVSVTTVSNHLSDLEEEGVIEGYTPKVDYDAVGYDVTAIMQLKAEGSALPEITQTLKDHRQMISVYEVTGTTT